MLKIASVWYGMVRFGYWFFMVQFGKEVFAIIVPVWPFPFKDSFGSQDKQVLNLKQTFYELNY